MKLVLLPCIAIAVLVAGCGDDDGDASPGASMRVGVPAVEASITLPASVPVASAPANGMPSDAPAVGSEYAESADTTTAPAYVDVDVGPGLGTDGFVGAREDVQLDRCELDGDHWVAAGRVTNSSGAGAAYRVYVAFNPPYSTAARGLVQVDLLIPDAETQPWEAIAWITDPGLECVLRVERISG
ncbi:MAG TPA: hypothetical protein VFV63_21405 [Ilumatobacteraceae bacterium]|nr:hypothetical protein [Ilumatobacteraceae bacterium]